MNFSAIGPKILIMTDNYASYIKWIFWNVTQPMRQANCPCPFYHFLSSPYQHLFYHISNAISTQILCGIEISINTPLVLRVYDMFLILETDSTRRSN